MQLDAALMKQREIEDDLLEFLTAPPSVQKLSPEMWLDAWDAVIKENPDLVEKRKGEAVPYCKICGRWAQLSHLMSAECKANREQQGASTGPLLTEILAAERLCSGIDFDDDNCSGQVPLSIGLLQ